MWERLGRVDVYSEPFAGSLAVLLGNPYPAAREVVCDTDGGICNFWRAIRADPEAVAHHADYPTIHQDLTARHRWLREWIAEHAPRLSADPDFYSAKAAGWWVWGISIWIGGDWCRTTAQTMPLLSNQIGRGGVSIPDKRPYAAQANPPDRRPHVSPTGSGIGVSIQNNRLARHSKVVAWFEDLADRLARVIVLNRSWESAVTPAVLADTPTCAPLTRAIFLDPPYVTGTRSTIYGSDVDGTSDDVAAASWEWAQEHGERYRIAYCAHEGDVEPPPGWTMETRSFSGIRDAKRREERQDAILFSPACLGKAQQTLF